MHRKCLESVDNSGPLDWIPKASKRVSNRLPFGRKELVVRILWGLVVVELGVLNEVLAILVRVWSQILEASFGTP